MSNIRASQAIQQNFIQQPGSVAPAQKNPSSDSVKSASVAATVPQPQTQEQQSTQESQNNVKQRATKQSFDPVNSGLFSGSVSASKAPKNDRNELANSLVALVETLRQALPQEPPGVFSTIMEQLGELKDRAIEAINSSGQTEGNEASQEAEQSEGNEDVQEAEQSEGNEDSSEVQESHQSQGDSELQEARENPVLSNSEQLQGLMKNLAEALKQRRIDNQLDRLTEMNLFKQMKQVLESQPKI